MVIFSTLTLTEADHAAIADALSTLESKLSALISVSADQRRSLNKMGEKSETFCRRTLVAMSENPGLIPADVDVAEAQRDMAQFDALRSDVPSASRAGRAPIKARRPPLEPRPARHPSPVRGAFFMGLQVHGPCAQAFSPCSQGSGTRRLGFKGLRSKAQKADVGDAVPCAQGSKLGAWASDGHSARLKCIAFGVQQPWAQGFLPCGPGSEAGLPLKTPCAAAS